MIIFKSDQEEGKNGNGARRRRGTTARAGKKWSSTKHLNHQNPNRIEYKNIKQMYW